MAVSSRRRLRTVRMRCSYLGTRRLVPGVTDRSDEAKVFRRMEGLANFFFGEIENRVAAGALVAGVKQGVEGEGVVLWRGDLFLDERAEDAELMGREMHGYKGATAKGRCVERRISPIGRGDNEGYLCRRTSCYFSVKIRCERCCRMTT